MMEYNNNNPLRVFTAFSGYDSQMMALQRLKDNFPGFDFICVGWSEIDENAIAAHNACFPNDKDKNYGDISKIDWEKVPDFDLFTMSSPCFVKDTLVLTDKGCLTTISKLIAITYRNDTISKAVRLLMLISLSNSNIGIMRYSSLKKSIRRHSTLGSEAL